MSSLSIVIVNWNAGALLRECLASLPAAAAGLPDDCRLDQVVVVDNASSDGSADGLEAAGLRVQVLRNADNRGFARACNQGARATTSELLLFLNPDTRLYPDSLAAPVRFLRQPDQARTGIVGIQLVDASGQISRSCSRFPAAGQFAAMASGLDRRWPALGQPMQEWDHGQTRAVDQVIGAFFLVRREVFDALGGFDERFFVYFEEVDFALRAAQRGWRSVYLASAQAYHRGGGTTEQVKARRLFYALRSRLAYGAKHFGPLQRLALGLVTWLLEPASRSLFLALRGRWREIGDVAAAYAMLAGWKRAP